MDLISKEKCNFEECSSIKQSVEDLPFQIIAIIKNSSVYDARYKFLDAIIQTVDFYCATFYDT